MPTSEYHDLIQDVVARHAQASAVAIERACEAALVQGCGGRVDHYPLRTDVTVDPDVLPMTIHDRWHTSDAAPAT